MTPIRVELRPGRPIVDQVVHASIKAILSGRFMPGDSFPSVRMLASDLKIHPNTAHKAIQQLVREKWLEVHTGIGTLVAKRPVPSSGNKTGQLDDRLDQLVVEARSIGVSMNELQEEIARRWAAINDPESVE